MMQSGQTASTPLYGCTGYPSWFPVQLSPEASHTEGIHRFQAYTPGDAPCRTSFNVYYVNFMCQPGKTCINGSFQLLPSRVVAAGRSTSYIDTVGAKRRALWLSWAPVAVPIAAVARSEPH